MNPQRLPIVSGDDGTWGDILNQYIGLQHYDTGLDSPMNGGHKTITIRPGTTAVGTAPLKFASGPLNTTSEAGAVEFLNDALYMTQTSGAIRKKIAMHDDNLGATGDIYYRDSSGYFKRLPIGTNTQILTSASGLPIWQTATGVINNMDGGTASATFGGAAIINGGGA